MVQKHCYYNILGPDFGQGKIKTLFYNKNRPGINLETNKL